MHVCTRDLAQAQQLRSLYQYQKRVAVVKYGAEIALPERKTGCIWRRECVAGRNSAYDRYIARSTRSV